MNHLKPLDLVAATLPTFSATIIGGVNEFAGLVGTVTGIAYLIWKWRREAMQSKGDKE